MLASSPVDALSDTSMVDDDISTRFQPCVLVLEDSRSTLQPVYDVVSRNQFAAEVVRDGDTMVERATAGQYVAILITLAKNGPARIEVCRMLRAAGVEAPILLLAESGTCDDIVLGLNSGADDFMMLPVNAHMFTLRLQSFLQRCTEQQKQSHVRFQDLSFDVKRRMVWRVGRTISLSRHESCLLELLLRHRGQLLPSGRLAGELARWHDTEGRDFDSLMRELRRKLDLHAPRPLIRVVEGIGYVLDR